MNLKTVFFAALVATSATAQAQKFLPISVEQIVAKYGKPDIVRSSEFEKPRPPFVTKFVEFKKERVRFTLLANAPIGTPPPYKSWLLMGYQDPTSNVVLTEDEAMRRLGGRKK